MKALHGMCVAAVTVALSLSSANALCIYHGKMYAKTTLAQEFADSQWVVRVKVVAADNHWSVEDDSWTIYHLQVVTAFKGKPPARIKMFTYRDSGGFYLDKGMANDLGGEYLLFLDPVNPNESAPAAARDATEVNYSCGQSKAWNSLSMSEHHKLVTLGQGSFRSSMPLALGLLLQSLEYSARGSSTAVPSSLSTPSFCSVLASFVHT